MELLSLLPPAVLMLASILGAAWCVVRGSTIGASAMVEKPETSIWGLVLNVMGALILLFGFATALMLIMPESLPLLIIVAGEIGVAACIFPIVSLLGRLEGKTSNDEMFPRIATWATTFIVILASSILIMLGGDAVVVLSNAWPLLLGAAIMILAVIIIFPRTATWATTFIVILASSILIVFGGSVGSAWLFLLGATAMILAVIKIFPEVATLASTFAAILIFSIFVMMSGGGGVGVIPDNAWPLLLGAVTMLGSALCAAICIMVAVKSGSAAMVEKPELSIWSLLFVALGEGLAIYGLIVALLIVMA